jgi:hypothetical protein
MLPLRGNFSSSKNGWTLFGINSVRDMRDAKDIFLQEAMAKLPSDFDYEATEYGTGDGSLRIWRQNHG